MRKIEVPRSSPTLRLNKTKNRSFFGLETRTADRFEFSWHYHRAFELTLIVKSQGRSFVGDRISEYTDGDLILLAPLLPHTWCSTDEGPGYHSAIVVWFDDRILGHGGGEGFPAEPVRRLFQRARRGIRFRGPVRERAAHRMQALPTISSPLRQWAEILLVLDELCAADDDIEQLSSKGFIPDFRPESQHPIDQIYAFIEAHLDEPISREQAASEAAMSVSSFSRFFRRTTGKAFHAYLNEVRMSRACQLLIQTDRTVADIAEATGFHNVSGFNRNFLKLRDKTPSAFRREFRRIENPNSKI